MISRNSASRPTAEQFANAARNNTASLSMFCPAVRVTTADAPKQTTPPKRGWMRTESCQEQVGDLRRVTLPMKTARLLVTHYVTSPLGIKATIVGCEQSGVGCIPVTSDRVGPDGDHDDHGGSGHGRVRGDGGANGRLRCKPPDAGRSLRGDMDQHRRHEERGLRPADGRAL